jgi:hypothetical protein
MTNCIIILTGAAQRMWALQKLRRLISANFGQTLNVNELLLSPTLDTDQDLSRSFSVVSIMCLLSNIVFMRYSFLIKHETQLTRIYFDISLTLQIVLPYM